MPKGKKTSPLAAVVCTQSYQLNRSIGLAFQNGVVSPPAHPCIAHHRAILRLRHVLSDQSTVTKKFPDELLFSRQVIAHTRLHDWLFAERSKTPLIFSRPYPDSLFLGVTRQSRANYRGRNGNYRVWISLGAWWLPAEGTADLHLCP